MNCVLFLHPVTSGDRLSEVLAEFIQGLHDWNRSRNFFLGAGGCNAPWQNICKMEMITENRVEYRERERGRERNIPKHQPVITSNPMPSLHMRHLAKTAQNFWAGCLFEWFTGSTIMVLSTSQPRHDQRKSHPPLHLPFPDRYRTPTLVALFFTKPVVSSAVRQWIAIFCGIFHLKNHPKQKTSPLESRCPQSFRLLLPSFGSQPWSPEASKRYQHGRSVWVPLRLDWRGSVYWHKVTIYVIIHSNSIQCWQENGLQR